MKSGHHIAHVKSSRHNANGFKPLLAAASFVLYAMFASSYAEAQSGGYGMMGAGGMMGGWGSGTSVEVSMAAAMQEINRTTSVAEVDKAHNRVTFSGSNINIAIAAVQPNFPDTTFEVAGLVDPTIVVPRGATITLTLINMDYGQSMNHGVEVTSTPPPYPVLTMMGMPDALAFIPILPPRTSTDLQRSQFAESTSTFSPSQPGDYYYLCQYYDHASKGMYGKLVVSGE